MSSAPHETERPTALSFADATAVTPCGEDRFTASIDTGWSAPMGPNGGYVAAVIVRAMLAALDPGGKRRLRSLTCHYLRPLVGGPVELAVEQVRSGRRLTTGRVRMLQGGRDVVAALGSLAATGLETAATWSPSAPPVAPAPAPDAVSVPFGRYGFGGDTWFDPAGAMSGIGHRIRMAPRLGPRPFSGTPLVPGEAAESGGWLTLPEHHRLDTAFVVACTDFWWPPSQQPVTQPAWTPTIDLTVHVRADLGPDGLDSEPVLGVFRSAAAVDGLVEADGQLFLADGTLLAQSRQLALFAPMG